MKLEDLSYEQAEAVINSLQALLAEANEDVPFNVEGEDQDPESYDKKEDAHLS